MSELLNELNFNFPENFSLSGYTINILIAAILLYILSLVYRRYGNSISNRNQLSKVLIIVGVTTFIIISIVKSSLALSLGLVGALSIIRFRTAIKELEELGYFFIAICIGLGMGASQLVPTVIGFLILVLIIVVLSKNKLNGSLTQNLVLSVNCKEEERSGVVSAINNILENNVSEAELKRLNHSENKVDLNFLINVSSMSNIEALTLELFAVDSKMKITFLDNQI